MKRRVKRRPKKRFFILLFFIAITIWGINAINTFGINPDKIFTTISQLYSDKTANADEDKKFIVCIDPGHGGYDSGAISLKGIQEKDINLNVSLKVGKILEKNNIKTVYTRTNDNVKRPSVQKDDLATRCKISNDANSDIYVSIHCNFDEVSSKTKGVETWCRFRDTEDEKLAMNIQKHLVDTGYTNNRGIKYEADGKLYVLKNTKAISVLVELGFLSNATETNFLQSDDGQDKCAQAIAQAILEYQ